MRIALLIAALLPACANSNDATISGTYYMESFDSAPINGNQGGSVVEITAKIDDETLDFGTFHDPTQEGSWG
jgi:hypothetical protein